MQNKFPLWKNVALIVLVIIAFIYALPNLYSEEPAVQVSSETPADYAKLQQQIQSILNSKNLPYKDISYDEHGVEVRFNSTDTQLVAKDAIKQAIGSQYTVALNLVAATPSWLTAIGAHPMKQGLDLRGGVHFLLEVDVDSVIARRYEGLMKNMSQDLREKGIRYTGLRYTKNQGIDVQFASEEIKAKAMDVLRVNYAHMLFDESIANNTVRMVVPATELNTIRQNTIEQTMSILRNRVDELGVGESVVQQQGGTRVAVDLPGLQDATRAKLILGGTATLEFHLVDYEHDAEIAKQTGAIPVNSKLYIMDGRPILLKRQIVLSGDSITSATSSFDQQSATPAVQVQLGGGGEAFFTKVTRENIGRQMAIVFVETKTSMQNVNGVPKLVSKKEERVISAPVIQSALPNHFQITGMKSAKEAADLALLLRAGALPASIYYAEERTVGPSLGKENIQRGIISLEVGMTIIFVIMLIYYRFFGLVANIALILNLVFLTALLSIIGAVLTMPGIAGIVLTVGMAVDANVLIYERIREELRNGFSPQVAIHAGYERAFSTIIDANVTTLIVAIVLFAVGSGPVRGFAVTLTLGLLTSMLTGITYTRAIVNWYYGGRVVKRLSVGI